MAQTYVEPLTKSLSDFMGKLNECAERAFSGNTQHMMDRLLHAKLPPHLKRSLNLACLENDIYNQTVAHFEKELELSGLENDGDLSIPTMTPVPPNINAPETEQPKTACQNSKNFGHLIRDCRKRIRKN